MSRGAIYPRPAGRASAGGAAGRGDASSAERRTSIRRRRGQTPDQPHPPGAAPSEALDQRQSTNDRPDPVRDRAIFVPVEFRRHAETTRDLALRRRRDHQRRAGARLPRDRRHARDPGRGGLQVGRLPPRGGRDRALPGGCRLALPARHAAQAARRRASPVHQAGRAVGDRAAGVPPASCTTRCRTACWRCCRCPASGRAPSSSCTRSAAIDSLEALRAAADGRPAARREGRLGAHRAEHPGRHRPPRRARSPASCCTRPTR